MEKISLKSILKRALLDALKKVGIEHKGTMEEIVHSRSCFFNGIQIPGHQNVCTCGADESLSPMPWD